MFLLWTPNLDSEYYYSYIIYYKTPSNQKSQVTRIFSSPFLSKKEIQSNTHLQRPKTGQICFMITDIQNHSVFSQIPQNSQKRSYIHWKKSELVFLRKIVISKVRKEQPNKVSSYCPGGHIVSPFLPISSPHLGLGSIWQRRKWQIGAKRRSV